MRAACMPKLDGIWVPITASVSGRQLSVRELRVARFVIEHESYRIVDRSDSTVDRGELKLDEEAMPCALDIVGIEGPNAGKHLRAIIEFDGDRLCVCYDLEHQVRPHSMRPVGDQLLLSITYARAAPVLLS